MVAQGLTKQRPQSRRVHDFMELRWLRDSRLRRALTALRIPITIPAEADRQIGYVYAEIDELVRIAHAMGVAGEALPPPPGYTQSSEIRLLN